MKKLISILLCITLVCSLQGCDNTQKAKKSANIIEIEGHQYDLSQDFVEVATSMTKDGLMVCDAYTGRIFSDEGEWRKFSTKEVVAQPNLFAWSKSYANDSYHISGFEFDYNNSNFKTVDNIAFQSTAEDLQNLEGYISCYNTGDVEQIARVALYEDGELIDLGKYRTMLKEIDVENETALKKFMYEDYEYASYVRLVPVGVMGLGYGNLLIFQEDMSETIKMHESMLVLAAAEALYRLEQGEITSITEIRYSYVENAKYVDNGMKTQYKVITLADDEKAE